MQITATHLTKRYESKVAVDDLSFEVHEGRVTGFLGPNGAGKSTAMRMILGLHRPDAGQVLMGGKPLTSYSNPLQIVGSLLDAKDGNPRSTPRQHLLAQAVTHGLGMSRVDEILSLAGLGSVADKKIGGFSLGMSQRLGIANALLADPQVLVLDEPINGLDPEGVRWMRETLRALAGEGRTILLSSHLMSEMAQTADHVIVIGKGRILADAPVAEIVAGGGSTRVRSPQLEQLLPLLEAAGAVHHQVDGSTVTITGIDSESIGRIAAADRIVLVELVPIQHTLEDAYLDLTAGAVEYTTGVAA